jgi:hypothetical protein
LLLASKKLLFPPNLLMHASINFAFVKLMKGRLAGGTSSHFRRFSAFFF